MGSVKRNETWDIVKGLGILFVVAGHGYGGGLSQFVNLFHIPLFFFVSGLVFKFQDRSFRSAIDFIVKCMKSLWLPSLIYGIFYVLCHNVFVRIGLYELDLYSWKQIGIAVLKHVAFLKTEPLESAMWFLTAIFIGRCLLYAVLWLSSFIDKDYKQTVFEFAMVVLIFIMGCVFFYKGISLPGNADNACSLMPFMYVGYKLKNTKISYTVLIIPCLVILIGLLIWSGQTLRMSRNEIVNPAFFLIVSSAGICLTFQIGTLLKEMKIGRIFSYFGKNTISILCLHLLAFRLISFIWINLEGLPISYLSKHPVVGSSYLWGTLYTAAGVVLPLIVPYAKNRIRKIGRAE